MIIFIRHWLKKGGFQVILWIVLAAFFIIFLLPSTPQIARRAAEIIITINGQDLTTDVLERKKMALEEQLQQARRQWGQYAEALLRMMGLTDLKTAVMEQMIREALLDQAAAKLKLNLNSDFVQDKFRDPYFLQTIPDLIPPYTFEQGGINERALNAHMQRFGLSTQDFNYEIMNALKRILLNNIISAAGYIPSFEIKEQINKFYVPKKFSIMTLPLDAFYNEEKKKELSSEKIKQFFDKKNALNKHYMIPEKRSGFIWKFEPNDYNISVNEDEIEAYYNAHKVRQFADKPAEVQVRRILFTIRNETELPAILARAQQLREELVLNPDKFEEKAKELSEDAESAKKGGLLPFFSRGTYEKEFEKAAFLLKNDGDISSVIQTDKGIEILQRVSKKTQTFKPLSKVEREIREKMRIRKFKEQFLQDMKELLEDGDVDNQKLQEFIKRRGGSSESVGPITKDQSKLSQKLFRLKKGGLSFYIDGQTGVAVKLTSVEKAYIPALETVKDTVVRDLHKEQASKQMKIQLEKARKQTATESLETVAKQLGASVKKTGWITPDDTKIVDELRNKGIPVELFQQLEKVGGILSSESDENSYLIRLDEIKPLEEKINGDKEQEIKSSSFQEQLALIDRGFVASLYRNAIIKAGKSSPLSTEDNTE